MTGRHPPTKKNYAKNILIQNEKKHNKDDLKFGVKILNLNWSTSLPFCTKNLMNIMYSVGM